METLQYNYNTCESIFSQSESSTFVTAAGHFDTCKVNEFNCDRVDNG